ncbi:hypothetical protein FH972_016852 [Carpinus fangiana]|uniref:Uncharacterized protein n=1 Tax=Carpinus fangiana TaxID=176857 RepID=A0A5N6RKF8_9ROSI|nr:hypothetical protein FH972_016852 [Carpinus fangiana]
MLQLFFAVAFSAVPLTLYVPPIRSLNLFVETIEDFVRQTTVYTLRAYPRVRLAFSRIINSILRPTRSWKCFGFDSLPYGEKEVALQRRVGIGCNPLARLQSGSGLADPCEGGSRWDYLSDQLLRQHVICSEYCSDR